MFFQIRKLKNCLRQQGLSRIDIMKIKKTVVDEIKRCYSVAEMQLDGESYFFFASEDPNVGAQIYNEKDLTHKKILWQEPGGCMSLIPYNHHQFIAVQEFYLKVSPSQSKLVWGQYDSQEGWKIREILKLPYLHRFDIYHQDNEDYLICATIADDKENKEDWSQAGKIYGARLPKDLAEEIQLEVIAENLFKNHGYSRSEVNGRVCGYFSSTQGVVQVFPPQSMDAKWEVHQVLKDHPISEAVFIDLDNDGLAEMMTIEPFHGNQMKIYKLVHGEYQLDYTYPYEIDFAHALVADTILGKPSFIAGVRRKDAELVIIQKQGEKYVEIFVDKHGGPANLKVVHRSGYDLILSANHTRNEATIYTISKEE